MSDISLISHSSTVRGNISGAGSLHIEGRVRGDISVTGDVVLGPQAQVAGNISAATVTVDGALEGDVTATVALSVGGNAKVVGDLQCPEHRYRRRRLGARSHRNRWRGAPAAPVRARGAASSLVRAPIGRRPELARPELPSRESANRFVAPRVAAPAPRREAPAPSRRRHSALKPAIAPVATQSAFDAEQPEVPTEAKAKKQPPPPVVTAPRKGAKGRKKIAKRE